MLPNRKLGIVHTGFVTKDKINELLYEMVENLEIINIVDDSLLEEVIANGHVTSKVQDRIYSYAKILESLDVSLILNQCSSVSEVVDLVQPFLKIPFVKIDESMMDFASKNFKNIGVVASLETTLDPSVSLLEQCILKNNSNSIVNRFLAKGAYQALVYEKDRNKHNRLLLETIEKASKTCDCLVLAQGSMHVLLKENHNIDIPILTSMKFGLEAVSNYFKKGETE